MRIISYIIIIYFISFNFFVKAQNNDLDSLSTLQNEQKLTSYDKAEYLKKLATESYIKKEYPKSISLNKKALSIFLLNNKKNEASKTFEEIGDAYFEVNDYDNALKFYLNTLELFEENNPSPLVIKIKKKIGELYVKIEQCENAFKYLNEVKNAYSKNKSNYKKEFSEINQSLGIAFGKCGSLDSALYYFQLSLQTISSNDSNIYLGGIINNIGAIYSKKNDNEKALNYYHQSLDLFNKLNHKNGIAVSTSNIAYIYKKQNKYKASIQLYEKALSIFRETNSLLYLRDNYLNISDVYAVVGDYKKALKYNNLYLDINDSITNSEVLSKISSLQKQFEIRKKDQELLLLEQEKQLIEKDNKIKETKQYLIIGGLILLFIIGFLSYRNLKISLKHNKLKQEILKQEKEELTQDLNFKSKELEEFALRIIEKNELLEQLKLEMKSVEAKEPQSTKKLKELSNSINSSLYIDKDRKEFELQLNKTYQSFFLKLDKEFPDLTKNERRLCSLLVLELSSKDIATILNISPDGVKKSRYRLRKKLNLESDFNLTDFLKNL